LDVTGIPDKWSPESQLNPKLELYRARGELFGVLKLDRTIADLASDDDLAPKHLSEAVQYRTLDRNLWV
jgi:predicted ATPase with chaperone activity